MAVTARNLWSLHTIVDAWTDYVNFQHMVDTRHSNHFEALLSVYILCYYGRRLIVSEVLPVYIVYQSWGRHGITRSGSTRRKGMIQARVSNEKRLQVRRLVRR
jgi:hypothetical protein